MRRISNQSFEFDIFLGGPPDRRSPFPYKSIIKESFPELAIYDWEDYIGEDYQEHNDQTAERSVMMVSLIPPFPMPGIGPEVGYFYRHHKTRIKASQAGICIGMEPDEGVDPNEVIIQPLKIKHTKPINCVILIWPDSVQPDFTKKTIAHYGLIVNSMEGALEEIKNNLEALEELERYLKLSNYLRLNSEPTTEIKNQKCTCPQECDCQNPPPNDWNGRDGIYHISNSCPIHNINPEPDPDCPIH